MPVHPIVIPSVERGTRGGWGSTKGMLEPHLPPPSNDSREAESAEQLLEATGEKGVVNVPWSSGMLFVAPDPGSFGFEMISFQKKH